MQLDNHEYGTGCLPTEQGFADAIIISRAALEKWRDHYFETGKRFPIQVGSEPQTIFNAGFYAGKHEVIVDLLKHFPDGE